MRIARVLGVIGRLVRLFSIGFIPPLLLALYDGAESGQALAEATPFLIALPATFFGGWILTLGFQKGIAFRRAEALSVVAGSWLIIAHFAAIPYLFSGLHYTDALFESMSGFTTTGATILTDFSIHTRAFFLWRSMTQWVGGLGIIALFVVILPQLGIAGRQLFFAESSTAPNEVVSSRVRESARRLWVLYVSLTLLLVALLMSLADWPVYESVCHALTTMCAGGFSPNPLSVGGYQSPAAEWILIFFMLIAGTSFPLLWVIFTRRPLEWARDGEFRFYLLAFSATAISVAFFLSEGSLNTDAIRQGAFQSISLLSSTGYASTDYNLWGVAPKVLLLMVMLVGGCAGSAAGGAKAIRHLLSLKFLGREIKRSLHPRAVLPIKHKGHAVSDSILRAVLSLVLLYFLGYLLIGTLLTLFGIEMDVAFTAALACLGNVGPGLGEVGPMGSYANFPVAGKVLLTAAMWIGRLEIVTVLALLHPDIWTRIAWTGEDREVSLKN